MKLRNFSKFFILFVVFPLSLTLILDIFYGRFLIGKTSEKKYRVPHPIYHHTFKPNYSTNKAVWNDKWYTLCTDSRGFKYDCKSTELKKYDIAFIGDSFIEGVGYPYEKTFAGIIDSKIKSKVVNFSAVSYSPVVYYHKVKQILDDNLYFGHLVVFVDISDIQDETVLRDCGQYVCGNLLFTINKYIDEDFQLFIPKTKVKIIKTFPLHHHLYQNSKNLYYKLKRFLKYKKVKKTNYNAVSGVLDYNYHRGSWTYNPDAKFYGSAGIEGGVKNATSNMEKLYNLLQENNIKLSVAVYPHPGQILHDEVNSKQVKIWKKFCENKCHKFFNFFPSFFNYAKTNGKHEAINKFYVKNDGHLNEEGNRFFAEEFLSIYNK